MSARKRKYNDSFKFVDHASNNRSQSDLMRFLTSTPSKSYQGNVKIDKDTNIANSKPASQKLVKKLKTLGDGLAASSQFNLKVKPELDSCNLFDTCRRLDTFTVDIKKYLQKRQINISKCLLTFQNILQTPMSREALLNSPSFVETIKRCRKFTGSVEIRTKATEICEILLYWFPPNENNGDETSWDRYKRESDFFISGCFTNSPDSATNAAIGFSRILPPSDGCVTSLQAKRQIQDMEDIGIRSLAVTNTNTFRSVISDQLGLDEGSSMISSMHQQKIGSVLVEPSMADSVVSQPPISMDANPPAPDTAIQRHLSDDLKQLTSWAKCSWEASEGNIDPFPFETDGSMVEVAPSVPQSIDETVIKRPISMRDDDDSAPSSFPLQLEQESRRSCPVCDLGFSPAVTQEQFEEHVQKHFDATSGLLKPGQGPNGRMCPVCSQTYSTDDFSQMDFEAHVAGHFGDSMPPNGP